MRDKNQLLKDIVTDLISFGKKKDWKSYALEEGLETEFYERCRSKWKTFKKEFYPKNLWSKDEHISDEWKTKVERALAVERGEEFIPEAPSGFVTSRMHQQQTKDGSIIWLQSVERDKEVDIAKEFYDKAVTAFENIILKHEPHKVYLLPRSKPTNFGFNLLLSDMHIGSTIKDSLFNEQYNRNIYLDRVKSWLDIIEQAHKTYGTFKYLNIINLGDAIDGYGGQTTRKLHPLVQEFDYDMQFDTFVKSLIDFFNTIVEEGFAEKIRFVSANNSNHGGYAEYAAARAVEIYLNAKFPDIETIVKKDFMIHFTSGKHVHITCHGKDQQYMKQPIPWVLNKEAEVWFENYIQYHSLNKHIPFNQEKNYISVYLGDLHQSKTEFSKRFRYKRVMSLMGGTDFIEYNYSRGSGYKGFEWEIFDINTPFIIEGRHFFF